MNTSRREVLASHALVAASRRERLRGLIGRDGMSPGTALVIDRCRQVHTFGMRFPIDVLFADGRGRVVRVCNELAPRRVSPVVWRSKKVVELPGGILRVTGTCEGDIIEVVEPG